MLRLLYEGGTGFGVGVFWIYLTSGFFYSLFLYWSCLDTLPRKGWHSGAILFQYKYVVWKF